MRGRRSQPREVGNRVRPDLVPDAVDAGLLDVLHVADKVALGTGEIHLHLFVVEVDLVGDTVGGAPDALGLEEAVAEHLGEDVVVVAFGAEFGVGEFDRRQGRACGDEGRIGLWRSGWLRAGCRRADVGVRRPATGGSRRGAGGCRSPSASGRCRRRPGSRAGRRWSSPARRRGSRGWWCRSTRAWPCSSRCGWPRGRRRWLRG